MTKKLLSVLGLICGPIASRVAIRCLGKDFMAAVTAPARRSLVADWTYGLSAALTMDAKQNQDATMKRPRPTSNAAAMLSGLMLALLSMTPCADAAEAGCITPPAPPDLPVRLDRHRAPP